MFSLAKMLTLFTFLEYLSVLLSLISLYFDIKNHISGRWLAILSSLFGSYIYHQTHLYGSCGLSWTMIIMHLYGIYCYHTKPSAISGRLITSIGKTQQMALFFCSGSLVYLVYIVLQWVGQPRFCYLDALNTVYTLMATWWLVVRKLQAWILWLFVSLSCFFVNLESELYGFASLQLFYGCLNIWGYRTWRKIYQDQCHPNETY